MTWTVIRAATRVPTAWPNGRGITRDYAVRTATDGSFLWRVTLADLTEDAPFSRMPGTERVFTIARGNAVELTIDGAARRCEPFHPVCFSGGSDTSCRLLAGPARALNVMCDPLRVVAEVALLKDTPPGEGERVVFCPSGTATVAGLTLGEGDAAVGVGAAPVGGTALVVSLRAA